MKLKLEKARKILEECGILEAQESNTEFEQKDKEDQVFKKETDKSFKNDRINLEEILNSSGSKKKDYVKKVVKTVNQLIDGKKDIDNLINVVKKKGN